MRFLSSLSAALLSAASLLTCLPALAQPANDRCSQAQPIATGGFALANTANANDDLPGLTGCQTGSVPHPDVWFSFTATSSVSTILVTPDASSLTTPYEILVFDGTCGAGLTGITDRCSPGGTDSVRVSVTSGTTYYIAIASPSDAQTGIFIVQTVSRNTSVVPAQDCMNANILQTGAPIQQGPFNLGSGTVANEVTTTNSCFGAGSTNTAERQPKWYKFIAGSDGKLTFNINPSIYADDYDWAVWDITSDPSGCTTKGNAIACNWSGADGSTGLSLCPNLEPGYNPGAPTYDNEQTNLAGPNAPIDLQAGRIYALLVDNFSMSSQGFVLTFGGACPPAPGQPNPLADIGLEAEFDFTQLGCGEFEFHKRNPVAAGAAANLSYRWTFSNGAAGTTTSTLANPVHSFPSSTDTAYSVRLRIEIPLLPGLSWESSRFVTVNPPRPEVVRSAPGAICLGDSITLTASGGATYSWTGTGVPTGYTAPSIRVAPTATTTYRLYAMRSMCTDSLDVEVIVTPLPTTQARTAVPLLCAGSSTTLTATGAENYQWSPAVGLSSTTDSTVTATPLVTTTYRVVGSNGQCSKIDSVTITVVPQPTTRANAVIADLCQGASTTLTVTGAQRYEWSPATGLSSTTDSTVTANPTVTTTYIVMGYNGQCVQPDTVTITVVPVASASGTISGTEGILPYSTNFTSTVTAGTAWLWNFGDGQTSTQENPSHTYAEPGTYTVTLTTTYGVADCQTPVTEIGKVVVARPTVYNIMTPNGDGRNDVFSAPVSSQPINVRVYNRWGREVFSADNYQQNWKADDLAAGTYYYHISTTNGQTWKGWLEIVR